MRESTAEKPLQQTAMSLEVSPEALQSPDLIEDAEMRDSCRICGAPMESSHSCRPQKGVTPDRFNSLDVVLSSSPPSPGGNLFSKLEISQSEITEINLPLEPTKVGADSPFTSSSSSSSSSPPSNMEMRLSHLSLPSTQLRGALEQKDFQVQQSLFSTLHDKLEVKQKKMGESKSQLAKKKEELNRLRTEIATLEADVKTELEAVQSYQWRILCGEDPRNPRAPVIVEPYFVKGLTMNMLDWDKTQYTQFGEMVQEAMRLLSPFTSRNTQNGQWAKTMVGVMAEIHETSVVVAAAAPLFDATEYVRGNGYRSLLALIQIFVEKTIQRAKKFTEAQQSVTQMFGWKPSILEDPLHDQELLVYCQRLVVLLKYCVQIIENSTPYSIFPIFGCTDIIENLSKMNLEVFYGKYFCCQFPESLQRVFNLLQLALTSYGDAHKSFWGGSVDGGNLEQMVTKTRALVGSPKYMIWSNSKAKRCAELMGSKDINFVKSFWNLTETVAIVSVATQMVSPSPALNFTFTIHCDFPLERKFHHGEDGGGEEGEGSSHGTPSSPSFPAQISVKVRLISYEKHKGQIGSQKEYLAAVNSSRVDHNLGPSSAKAHLIHEQIQAVVPHEEAPSPALSSSPAPPSSALSSSPQVIPPSPQVNPPSPALSSSSPSAPSPLSSSSPDEPPKISRQNPPPSASTSQTKNFTFFDEVEEKEPSDTLILHIHGGGFVAQTSKSHLCYLLRYAHKCRCPILSVDYDLAPEAAFPIALYQVLSVYCWAIQNCELLGWNGKRIGITGDSAGGNLTVAVTVMTIMYNLRVPDFIVPVYPAVLAEEKPSPARLLSTMDPLLSNAILSMCLTHYRRDHDLSDPLLSPFRCSKEILKKFPQTHIFVGEFDPLIDDSVGFAHRLAGYCKNRVFLRIIPCLPHGFLNFYDASSECAGATEEVLDHIYCCVKQNYPSHLRDIWGQ